MPNSFDGRQARNQFIVYNKSLSGLYNPYVLFWTHTFESAYMAIAPIPVFVLTIDRIMALSSFWPNSITSRLRRALIPTAIITIAGCFIAGVLIYLIELPLDLDQGSS